MEPITASVETLLRQAGFTAADHMEEAVRHIDGRFGKGFAVSNPVLIAGFMQTAAIDFATAIIAQAIQELDR